MNFVAYPVSSKRMLEPLLLHWLNSYLENPLGSRANFDILCLP